MSAMTDSEDAEGTLLLRGARHVLPDRVTDKASLLVEDGRIQSLFEEGQVAPRPPMRTLDLDGLTLFPGFIDVHIHGAVGVDTMEADAEDLHRVAHFLAQNGVTAWLPTLVPAPRENYESAVRTIGAVMTQQALQAGRLRSRQEQARFEEGARVLGVHYEGPFVNVAQCGALRSAHFKSFVSPSDIDVLPTLPIPDSLRMITMAPEVEGGLELVQALNRRGWVISIGHTRATIDLLDRAYSAGARHMTHFMNAMTPLHHRSPGPVGWGLSRDDVTCDIIADGIHLDPLILRLLVKLKTPDRLSLISDAIAAAGMGDGEYNIWDETIEVKNGRTQNARGSIAGSVITMLDAVRMMKSLGVSERDIAQMGATNPARLLGVADDCGSIEEGKRADLVGLDDAGQVHLTIIGGRVAFESP
jgi:N-acetylglucosamine-6-phosphate deacetylase